MNRTAAARLSPAATFFEHVVDYKIPDPQEILSADTSKIFSALEADPLEVGHFRNLILLPLYLATSARRLITSSLRTWQSQS